MTSCKDYDDDINNLQDRIDALSQKLDGIKEDIQKGAVITSLTPVSNGVTLTLSNGQSYTITNGKDGDPGKDGVSWTIGDDGYWYKDTKKTDYYALGTKGDQGEPGTSAAARYYVPNPDTGCFDIYENGKKVESTEISFLGTGTITATLDKDKLSLYGVVGGANPTIISLNGKLTGLVFIPNIYWDGIESVEYPWIGATELDKNEKNQNFGSRATNKNASGSLKQLNGLDDWKVTKNDTVAFGPAWGVEYHLNPTNANVLASDVKGYNVLNPTIIETRALANKGKGVTSPAVDASGAPLFNVSNGILTAGLQIADPWNLPVMPTEKTYVEQNLDANTIALQVKSDDPAKPIITSDYAMLLPSKVTVEGLAWAKAPMYKAEALDLVKAGHAAPQNRLGDEQCPEESKKLHIWDTPKEALQDPDGAALEMYYNAQDFDLTQYMQIHAVKHNIVTGKDELLKLDYGQEAQWGLTYEFKLVDYTVDENVTGDSKYAKFISKGHLKPINVNEEGKEDPQSKTSIGREPLVQVLVKDHNGKVVLDGYVLIHITNVAPEGKDNKTIDTYPAGSGVFNFCDATDVLNTNWSQFNKFVLTDGLNNMTKEQFDQYYDADLASSTPIATQPGSGDGIYSMNMYENAPAKDVDAAKLAQLGTVRYYPNTNGSTNHRFSWDISEEEVEALTHDNGNEPVTVTRYIRFKAKDAAAPYAYVYIKLTTTVSRKAQTSVTFGKKNDNYWFGDNGADGGWDAIVLDVEAPRDGQQLNGISHAIRSTLVGNKEDITAGHKYYFVPDQPTTVTAQNGNKYTITPKSSDLDVNAESVYCKYVTAPAADVHKYDRETLDALLQECVIDYTKGAFTNTKLYAETGGVYTHIATLDPTTGVITLIKNDAAKDVLNAVGYAEKHSNITKEFNTFVGVAAKGGCDNAVIVKEDIFRTSWQRPINLKEFDNKVAIDANTNENTIYLYKLLHLFDWRGETKGYMWNDHQWFWAYYNVKAITIDMDPENVLTNMHVGNKFVPLSTITTAAKLFAYPSMKQESTKYTFNLSSYNRATKNQDLLDYMEANKDKFGAIYYANNGDNVTDFSVRIPVTIEYEWGYFKQYIQIDITRTTGH